MNIEIKNAIIIEATIGYEGHGILTADLVLELDGAHVVFGNWNLNDDACAPFIKNCLDTVEVDRFDKLKNKVIRVRFEDHKIVAIGHPIKEKWFNPYEFFK